jgi:Polysaccharide deacetylase
MSLGTPGKLLVFWDYDTQWGADADRARGLPEPQWAPELEFENTDRLLQLHAEWNVPACFAVVGAAALPGQRPYHDPVQVRRIHAAGHEIASHSFRHEWLPGLRQKDLLETLRRSKDALEQCTGASVVSFVPPYNQPFDYIRGTSISLSERKAAGRHRTTLSRLCASLRDTGYRFCRVSYRPLSYRLADRLVGRRVDRPCQPTKISGVTCIRLNTPGGFDGMAQAMLRRSASRGGVTVVYGHPHSLRAGNSQGERWLVEFFAEVDRLRRDGKIHPCRPRDLVEEA